MLNGILKAVRSLLIEPSCPLCRQPVNACASGLPCPSCRRRLGIPSAVLQGADPLPWQALALYSGELRTFVIRQRLAPEPSRLKGLVQLLAARCTLEKDAVLVPIPSWRRRQRRSFADLIAAGMGMEVRPILRRTRAGVGQHNLNRQQRLANLQGAFCVDNTAVAHNSDHIIWLADDILTTGATAMAARSALEASGHRVAGLICLARTPSPGRDLRCRRRQGDTPG